MAKKCMQCGGATKKMAKGGMPTKVLGPAKKPFAAGIPFFTGAGQTGPEYMKKGGAMGKAKFGATTPVKESCKKGMVRSADGKCVMERPKLQKGGMVEKKYQAGGKVNYMPSKAAYDKSISDMGGPDNPPVQLSPREIYKAKMDQKKRSVVNKMYPTTGIPKKGVGAKKYAKGGSSFGMLSVKAGVDKNPKPTAADRIAGAKKSTLTKKQLGGPATPNYPNPTKTLENAAMFIGGGLATALAARKQNQPMTQKKKEKVLAKQQKQAMRKKK